MIINSDAPRKIGMLIERLDDQVAPLLPSSTFDVVAALESTLNNNVGADADPSAAGWPTEMAEELRRLRRIEERALDELRALVVVRALEPDRRLRSRLSERLRQRLLLLLRCTRREEFLFLHAFWLDLSAD